MTDTAWQTFMASPADYAEPARLAECFGGGIGEAACEHMLGQDRLRSRLSLLLLKHYQLEITDSDEGPGNVDRAIALASAGELEEIALRSGAIYWGTSLAGIIAGPKAAALHTALGAAHCAFALANRDLAGPAQSLEPGENIRERVFADGWRCLGAWCHAMPDAIGKRVRLKLPPDELIDAMPERVFSEAGPAIAQRAAEREQ